VWWPLGFTALKNKEICTLLDYAVLDAEVRWATIGWTRGCYFENKNTNALFVSKSIGYRPYKWFVRKCTVGIDMNIKKKSGGFGKYLLVVFALRNLLVAVLWVLLFGTLWRLFFTLRLTDFLTSAENWSQRTEQNVACCSCSVKNMSCKQQQGVTPEMCIDTQIHSLNEPFFFLCNTTSNFVA
jgi:hypothetical protein